MDSFSLHPHHDSSELLTFFYQHGLPAAEKLRPLAQNIFHNIEDGDIFCEYCTHAFWQWDQNQLKSSDLHIHRGAGLRAIAGEAQSFCHTDDWREESLRAAGKEISRIREGYQGQSRYRSPLAATPTISSNLLYQEHDPLLGVNNAEIIKWLMDINEQARSLGADVQNVTISLSSQWQIIAVIRPDGEIFEDFRPLVRLNVMIARKQGDQTETGRYGLGGRYDLRDLQQKARQADMLGRAYEQAGIALQAKPAPAGELPVVLGPGWPGVLLHEAIGHGLEGDFNRKGSSAFTNLLGAEIAAPMVSVVDDATIASARGSLRIDDEGTQGQNTMLIEKGKLVGYLQDRQNAALMKQKLTGNGRRQSYAHLPIPRMTNTYMLNGEHTRDEMIESVEYGIFAPDFGGGQVDITNGKFVFSASEAWLIEKGRLTAPLKGAILIGDGPSCLTKITMVGNDLALDPGIGTCGKDGQSVPVGVGQPSLKLSGLTIGGTGA